LHPVPGYRSLSELSRAFAQKSNGLSVEDFVALDGALGLGGIRRRESDQELSRLASSIRPSYQSSPKRKPATSRFRSILPQAVEKSQGMLSGRLREFVIRMAKFSVRSFGWSFDLAVVLSSVFIGIFVLSKFNPQAMSSLSNWMAAGNIFEVIASLILAICAVFLTYRFSFFLIIGRTLGDSLVGWIRSVTNKSPDQDPSPSFTSNLIR
jgi:hypothetical protein